MAVIDARGNVFGRFNLIDVAVAAFLVVLVPMGYVASRVLRSPKPELLEVTPRTLTPEMPRRVRVTGRHFRPYLVAFVAKSSEPFVLKIPIESQQATFLIDSPTVVELALPPVEAGTYDIHIFDEAQEVASLQSAFTVAPLPRNTVDALVRFVVPPETAALVKEGDRDRWEQNGSSALTPSELATMGPVHATKDTATFATLHGSSPGVALEANVRIPAKARVLGGWEYKGEWLRSGETLTFETDRYRIFGVIGRLTELPAATSSMGPAGVGK
ncbi:MAG: hypothetical protein HY047_21590 [Acidobacteria bacterium]|nr:hypothetical protein [Acidobacteriota bacterium]